MHCLLLQDIIQKTITVPWSLEVSSTAGNYSLSMDRLSINGYLFTGSFSIFLAGYLLVS